jgi:hypothetical protein
MANNYHLEGESMTATNLQAGRLSIGYRDNAPPFVRYLARLLSDNHWSTDRAELLDDFRGVIALKSDQDPQSATIRADEAGSTVEQGVAADAAAVVSVVPTSPGEALSWEGDPDAGDVVDRLMTLLAAPLPHWTDLTEAFWAQVKGLPAMPNTLLVEDGGPSRLLTGGAGEYEVHGDAQELAEFLSGRTSFMDAVFDHRLRVSGTFSQFSVMTGASMKVMWNV